MPKALTRGELQARTREVVISAAQQVFLAKGYHATTIAQIAKVADRTHGAIYGHFASKETLCQEILRQHYEQVLARLGAALLEEDKLAAKLVVLEQQWRIVSAQSDWTTLTAEYIFATRQDADQARSIAETTDGLRTGIRMLLLSQAVSADIAVDDDELLEQAVVSVIGVGIGLIIAQVLGTIDSDTSAASFLESVRMWMLRLGLPPESLSA